MVLSTDDLCVGCMKSRHVISYKALTSIRGENKMIFPF